MDRIESLKNPRAKAARALHSVKGRDQSGMFLCEGEHMVQEAVKAANLKSSIGTAFALSSAFAVDTLFVDEAQLEAYQELIDEARAEHVFLVPAHVLEAITTVKSSQGIAAVVRLQTPQLEKRADLGVPGLSPAAFGIDSQDPAEATDYLFDELVSPALTEQEPQKPIDDDAPADDDALDDAISPSILGDKLVLMEAVQDPGNVGAILRTMDAAGFDGAILSTGCADPYAPKALRATMGSIFRVPTLQVRDAAAAAQALKAEGYAVIAAALTGKDFFQREKLPEKLCLIIGNEGAGITEETLSQATHTYRLPMRGGAESLNAAAAAAIMLYDLAYRS
ncbi:MAG TPA: RNA methyltransferase [Candidatus Limiplasma sp.]|nr:RNA methyltransferase [Candidatus Limiplasma sp.]HRX09903.1 RNA methyltransferase [Candidatus Limiplasma sp.]